MIKGNALFLLTVIGLGLTASCVGGVGTPINSKPTRTSVPRSTEETTESTPTTQPIETPTSENQQPPVDLDTSPSHPAARARIDLARLLRIKAEQIKVVKMTSREVDTEIMACLNHVPEPDKLLADLEEVQWIVLAVKGKRYHYVGMGDLVIYCGR